MTAAPAFVVLFVAALALSWLLCDRVRRSAVRSGFVDHPGGRKTQAEAVPLGGGIAVFATFAIAVVAGTTLLVTLPSSISPQSPLGAIVSRVHPSPIVLGQLAALLTGGAAALFTGLLDDRRKKGDTFPVWAKLTGQAIAALPALATGIRVTFLPGDALDVVATVLWIVLITNAINFLDNMDGLAAGVAAIATLMFSAVALWQGQLLIGACLVALLGSLCGFLPHNFFPARLYLGDAGTLALGNVLGVLTVLESYVTRESVTLLPILFPLIVLAVPVLDFAVAVTSRLREGRPIYRADQGHLSHRLVRLGLSRRAAVLTLYGVTLAFGGCAALLSGASLGSGLVALGVAALLALLVVGVLLRRGASPPDARGEGLGAAASGVGGREE